MKDLPSAARHPGRGRLKVFLGYAAGVGKTFRMLEEAQQLRAEGRDVVVGYFEPHGRQDTIAKIEELEVVPRRRIDYRGHAFDEMDTDAVLARRPQVCAVDEFAHTNVPGAERAKRWEEVIVLLDAGIDVLTTMNVQHLESLNDQLLEITGVKVRETIPDWVVKEAEEVVLIDLPPRALLNRLRRGVVYPPEKVQRAMESFFKEPTLAALRELAMRQTAHEVDLRHDEPGGRASAASDRYRGRISRRRRVNRAARAHPDPRHRPSDDERPHPSRAPGGRLPERRLLRRPYHTARRGCGARRAWEDRGAPRLRAAPSHRDAHLDRRRRGSSARPPSRAPRTSPRSSFPGRRAGSCLSSAGATPPCGWWRWRATCR